MLLRPSRQTSRGYAGGAARSASLNRSEEHTSELQSRLHLVCRLLLEKKKNQRHADLQVRVADRMATETHIPIQGDYYDVLDADDESHCDRMTLSPYLPRAEHDAPRCS